MGIFTRNPRRHTVTLRLDGKDYKVRPGDTFRADLKLNVLPQLGSENQVNMSGSVIANIKIVSVD